VRNTGISFVHPLPLQNLVSHKLVSRRQSAVVLTVKVGDYFLWRSNYLNLQLLTFSTYDVGLQARIAG